MMAKSKKRKKNSGEKQQAKNKNPPSSPSTPLSDALFGHPSSSSQSTSVSLTASIFGEATKKREKTTTSRSLFENTFQNVSRKHQQDNRKKHKQTNTKASATTLLAPGTVLKRRRQLTVVTQKVVGAITVDVASYTNPKDDDSLACRADDEDDDMEDPEVEQGIARLLVGRSSSIFRKQGVILLKSLLLPNCELLQDLQSSAKRIEAHVCRRLDTKLGRDSYRPPSAEGGFQVKSDASFRFGEVASRCLGRLDIRYGMDQPPFSHLHPSGGSNNKNSFSKVMWPLVKDLLGEDAQLVYMGLICSFPNSQDQPWHQDGTTLFPESSPDLMDQLPPYALNVFVPLLDITEDLGPTEFWLTSHCTDDARQTFLTEQSAMAPTLDETKKNIIGPLLTAGDALIYDYRICHRGTSNLSNTVRPMLYLMYARPWFKEHLNFGKERLFSSSGNGSN